MVLWCAPARAQDHLVFGLIAPRAAEQTRAGWKPFTDRLGTALHLPVELRVYGESAEMAGAFRKGEIDLAWMGNAQALEVVESGAGSVFAQMVNKQGGTGYHSVLVVPADSPLRSLPDVLAQARTLRFGDGDLKSTSGYLVPYYFAFQKNGINDHHAIFKSYGHASHQKNLTMAANGEVDVATANDEEVALFQRDYPALAPKVRVVWTSPLIPQSPLVWKQALPLELRRRILQFTVGFGRDDEERRILEQLNNLSGFRQSNNRQLVTVADLEMFKARQAINNDAGLSAAERAHRIQETIRRASRLDLMLKLSAASVR
jgi:phosphonate transport system substrate-binding protein